MAERARDASVDALRGVAIFTMVAANMAAGSLAEPHPFWFRLYGSFAAPLFVLLAGAMVARGALRGGRGFGAALARGALVVLVGALVDVLVWGIVPGTTVDVLYLIGLAIPLAWLATRAHPAVPWALATLCFALAPPLQAALGYSPYPTEYAMDGTLTEEPTTGVLAHWLVDGWFPVFPWLGFAFLGVAFQRLRPAREGSPFARPAGLAAGAAVVGAGAALWWAWPGAMLTRAGYSELFYPAVPGFVLAAIGLAVLLWGVTDRAAASPAGGRVLAPFLALGHASLLMYVLHLVVIRYVLDVWFLERTLLVFLAGYVAFAVALVVLGAWLARRKERAPPKRYLARFFLGG